MKTVKTITHLLLPIFIGLIIWGAVAGNKAFWVSSLVLLIVDIIVGISLQYFLDRQLTNVKPFKNDNWNSLTFEEKLKIIEDNMGKEKQSMRDKGIDVDGELKKYYDELRSESKSGKYKKSDTQCNDEN